MKTRKELLAQVRDCHSRVNEINERMGREFGRALGTISDPEWERQFVTEADLWAAVARVMDDAERRQAELEAELALVKSEAEALYAEIAALAGPEVN